MSKEYVLSFDGACEPVNPGGVASFGYLIIHDDVEHSYGNGVVGEGEGMTNNVAEYTGLIEGMIAVSKIVERGDTLEIRSDSQLAVRQMNGMYRVRSERIRPLYERAQKLKKALEKKGIRVKLNWVSREQNERADYLSHLAYQEYCRKTGYSGP
jgi:ribonuclease HI